MFIPTEIETSLADGARQFLQGTYSFSERAERLDNEIGLADWAALAEMGWVGLLVPEQFGGAGCSIIDASGVVEAFGAALHLHPVLGVAIEAVAVLTACAPSDERDALLAGIAVGTARPLLLDLKGTANSDASMIGSGTASAVHGASLATHFLVAAPDQNKLFVLPASAAEVLPRRGVDGSMFGEVTIDGKGAIDAAFDTSAETLGRARNLVRLGASAWALGVMELAISTTSDYVKVRKQFGQALGAFQAVRHTLADMRMSTDAARGSLRCALHAVDDPAAVDAAYLLCISGGITVTESAIQLHGGMGMTDDVVVSHLYKTVLRLQAQYGSPYAIADRLGRRWLTAA